MFEVKRRGIFRHAMKNQLKRMIEIKHNMRGAYSSA